MKRRGELRMIERAINQGWPTPPAERERAIRLALDTLNDENATAREHSAAIRVVHALIQHDGSTDAEIAKRAADASRSR